MNCFIGTLLFLCFVLSHGDLDLRIREKSNQIASHPLDQDLYLERGELYLLHEEFLKARLDFTFCLDHKLVNTRVLLGMSKSLLYLNSPDSAFQYVERVLTLDDHHLPALELKGAILSALGKYCDAARTLEQLIIIAERPSPALFLEAANDWESCSENGSSQKEIQLLEEGIRRIGAIGVLQQQLVSAYKRQGKYEEAIQILSSIIGQSDLKIRPYFERAQLYIEMHSTDKAKEDLSKALSLIDQLPVQKKSLASIENMRSEIIVLLTELRK
ncbi:MAG: hypothetical protein ABJB16_10480 [Saprospiraceae bacterium]